MSLSLDYELNFTQACEAWLEERRRRDRVTCVRILARIFRMSKGDFGDSRSVGGAVRELRLDFGPGYRVYYTVSHRDVVVVLCGGDKRSQAADIEKARALAGDL